MKNALKAMFNVLGALLALPFVVWARIGLSLLGSERLYSGSAQALALVPGAPGRFLRRGFYCLVLPRCPWDVDIHFGSIVTHPTTRLGRRAWVGLYSLIGTCDIGDDVIIGSRVSVLSGRRPHRFDDAERNVADQPGEYRQLTIGADCWLGEGVVVMADLGDRCVVGAGSVVVKPLAARTVAAGNPAREIGRRGDDDAGAPSGDRD
jgi:acetyltransferase-like isoleucine patch superfamily enzyme